MEDLQKKALFVWGTVAAILLVVVIGVGYSKGHRIDELTADENLKKQVEEKIACGKEDDIIKELRGRGFQRLLTAHPVEDHKIIQLIWAFNKEIAVTISHEDIPETMCLYNRFTDVTFNPVLVKELWDAYQTQNPGKDPTKKEEAL
jgi:hypothetical protein